MGWKKVEVEVRKGMRKGWFEVRVVGKDGKEWKGVMKKVEEFWSERRDGMDELVSEEEVA